MFVVVSRRPTAGASADRRDARDDLAGKTRLKSLDDDWREYN
jgi:hypothetical protein